MSINFPTSLDTLSNPSSGDTLSAVPHATQHADANDAIEALEAKVGINSSAVTTSHDYKLGEVTGTDKAVGKTATQTLTNKTLTSPIINLSSNATGDIYYRAADGTLARLPIGTTGNILDVSAGGLPEWTANPSATNASTTVAGIVEEATSAEAAAGTATGGTGARLFVNPSTLPKPFIVQDIGIATGSNASGQVFLTSNTDGSVLYMAIEPSSGSSATIYRLLKDTVSGNYYITHTTTLSTSSNGLFGICCTSGYVYVGASIAAVLSIRRYSLADLSGVTSMTGTVSTNAGMWSDGTNIYIGNGASTFDKYTISGTAVTNASTVTYTSSSYYGQPASDGTSVWMGDASFTGTVNIRKYPIAGGSATSTLSPILHQDSWYNNINKPLYFMGSSTILGLGWSYDISTPTAQSGYALHLMGITLP